MFVKMNRKAFTIVEIIISILILALIFGAAFGVMSYARKETEKGLWIQQCIGQLRNATRQIGKKIKEMSYPSTLVNEYDGYKYIKKICSYKERRYYDNSGRLRDVSINKGDESKHPYEIQVVNGKVESSNNDNQVVLMLFPICTSEIDDNSEYKPGKITWTRFVYEPTVDYEYTKLGCIYMEEYESEYDTRNISSNQFRAYNLNDGFDMMSSNLLRRKMIITDVSAIEIISYNVSSLIGVFFNTVSGEKKECMNSRSIVTFKIWCKHPKDNNVILSDMTSVTVNAEVWPL